MCPGALGRNDVSRWETGRRTPREWLPYLVQALGASMDDMTSPRSEPEPQHDTAAPLPALTALSCAELAGMINELCRRLIVLDNTFHGVPIAETACRSFKVVHRRMGAETIDSAHEREIQAAAAELAEIAGWGLFNEGYERQSRAFTQEAITLARWSGATGIELLATQNLALAAGSAGRPREELNLARSILEADRQVNPRVEAMFRAREGQGRQALGDDVNASGAFGRARSLLGDSAPDDGPEWAWWVTPREIDRQEGRVLCVTGEHRRAIPVLERASDPGRGAHVGYGLGSVVRLLESYLAVGAWADAERVTGVLAPVAAESSTAGIVDSVSALADRYSTAPEPVHDAMRAVVADAEASPYELF